MNFLQQKCRFGFYTQGKAALCKSFKCGDNDLDDFFTKDAFLQGEELLCKNCKIKNFAPFPMPITSPKAAVGIADIAPFNIISKIIF